MNNYTSVKVENLYKQYKLGVIGYGTLSADLQSWWAKVRGKDDPNAKVIEGGLENSRSVNITGDRFWALKDISFEVGRGEVLGIIGRNGAGKSTLLKVLSRITAPTKGSVKLKGRVASLLEVGTGFHPELTGRENIYLNGAILGMRRGEVALKLDQIVEFAEVEKFLDTPVKRYSSGMYVRLAFAVAAHLETDILIVDEVLAVGDVTFQKKCMAKMGSVAEQGRTILFVSHNMSSINNLCDSVIVLDKGQVIYKGKSDKAISYYLKQFQNGGEDGFSGLIEFEEDISKAVQIRQACLIDGKNEPKRLFDYQDDIILCIKVELRKFSSDLYMHVSVTDSMSNLIFVTSDEDVEKSRLSKSTVGKYEYRIKFPAKLLKPGDYRLDMRVSKKLHGCIDNASFSFEINDNKSHRSRIIGGYRKPAMIAPEILWDFKASDILEISV